ncbi:hypothetical protein BH23BAC2_BH23BAC2_15720 [soil metagenome]
MKYLIKAQRDGSYFMGRRRSGAAYGKIHEAKIFDDKFEALKDLRTLESCGQRIVAVTRLGKTDRNIHIAASNLDG